jgi:hypothetical protein
MLGKFEFGVNSHTNVMKIRQLVQNFLRETDERGHDVNVDVEAVSMPFLVI